jgi:hypothetical protein
MDGRLDHSHPMNGRSQYLLSLGAMLLMSACYKDDLDPAQLTNNPFDQEYVGENVFVSEGTYTETVFVPQIGNVLRQVIAFRVRSELFLSDVTYSVRVHDLENDQTILMDADPPGGDSFKYYKQNLVIGTPVCLELRLSNNLSAARAEEICVTL